MLEATIQQDAIQMQLTETTSGRATLSPAHQLMATVLFASNPEEVLSTADPKTMKALVRTLQKNALAKDFGLKPCDPATATAQQLQSYILGFTTKGLADIDSVEQIAQQVERKKLSHLGDKLPISKAGYFQYKDRIGGSVTGGLWVSLQKFLKEYAHKDGTSNNIKKLALLIETLLSDPSDPPIRFQIDAVSYHPAELFVKNERTYYINPIATDLLLEGCGWAPKLSPEERKNRISSVYMARRIYGNNAAKYTNRLDKLAEILLSFDAVDIGTPKTPHPVVSTSIVKRARWSNEEKHYFTVSSQSFLEKCLGIEKEGLSEGYGHFISDLALAHDMKLRRNPVHMAIEDISDELWELWAKDGGVPFYDKAQKRTLLMEPQEFIKESRPGGRKVIFYIDPRAVEQYFSEPMIVRRIEMRQTQEQAHHSEQLQLQPPPHGWLSPGRVAHKINLSSKKGIRAVTTLMKQLHEKAKQLQEENNPQIGYFSTHGTKGGATYFADPAIVGNGKPINRQRVLEIMREIAEQDPTEQAATSPGR